MSRLAFLRSGPVLGAGCVIVVALGIETYRNGFPGYGKTAPGQAVVEPAALIPQLSDEPSNTSKTEPSDQGADDTDVVESQPESAVEETPEVAEVEINPPSIDTFRLDPDGSMLVAGQAHPGWSTHIVLDGAELEGVSSDTSGQFVVFLSIGSSDQPRILSLISRDPAGDAEMVSLDEVIIAPTLKVADAPESDVEVAGAADATEGEDAAAVELVEEGEVDANANANASVSAADEPAVETTLDEDTAEPAPVPEIASEPATQTVLLANEEGVQVIQPAVPLSAAPEVMSNVALDAITYSQEGEVQLSGRAQGEGFVQVYLDNAPVITSFIAEDGNWQADLPEVDSGVYTLRIDETDAEGNVTSRVETPFKREDEALISEAQDAVDSQRITAITVQPGTTLWAISRERYGEGTLYVRVFEANRDRIRDPDLIYPGQVFNLPE